jgi:arylsulfatase A-like enzyme
VRAVERPLEIPQTPFYDPPVRNALAFLGALLLAPVAVLAVDAPRQKPNIVFILADEGIRSTNFHVAQAARSASRAALMTGCYPNRVGIEGAMAMCGS